MSILVALVLGVVQGITEFFPVSSSGHLALVGLISGLHEADITFDILVHLATLGAILVYFRRDWLQILWLLLKRDSGDMPRHVIGYLIVATLPAVVVGLGWKDQVEAVHGSPIWVGVFLLVTATLLLLGLRIRARGVDYASMTWWMAIAMGLAQAAAIMPGISRSGVTIMVGIFLGLNRAACARFSFLMAVPVIAGAGILAVGDLMQQSFPDHTLMVAYGVGFIAAFVSGFVALRFMMKLLVGQRFFYFGFYCLAVGVLAIVLGSL